MADYMWLLYRIACQRQIPHTAPVYISMTTNQWLDSTGTMLSHVFTHSSPHQ